jgi:GNAT superfamily N-acetyltransferase
MLIRELDEQSDIGALRSCVIELQDHERRIDARMPPGEKIVDAYLQEIFARCAAHAGRVLVAVVGNAIAGYVSILTRMQSDSLDDGHIEYGLIADLVVLEKYRNSGIGRQLIDAAEKCARSHNVRWLRICVLAENLTARQLYKRAGFSELYVDLEKEL